MDTQTTPEWRAEIESRRDVLLSYLLMTATIGGLIAMVAVYLALPGDLSVPEQLGHIAPFFLGWLIVVITWLWRGMGYRIRAVVFLLLAHLLSFFIFWRGGLAGSGRVWILLLPALAFVLVGVHAGFAAGGVSILTYIFFALAFSQRWIPAPQVAEDLTALDPWVGEGGGFLLVVAVMALVLWSSSRGWWEALKGAIAANEQLEARTQELEETTRQLHRRASQLQATAEIARAGSLILDPETLSAEVVNRIQADFSPMDVYYVGLYLLDGDGTEAGEQFAVLKAATGQVGQQLLETGHKLELNEASPIGWCITHEEPLISLGAEDDTVRFDISLLNHTRSGIALPLRSRGRTSGALSVQSTREAAFEEADVSALQTMADQVALAIDNARLFSQTEAALKEVQAAHRLYLAEAWREFLVTRPVTRVDHVQPGTEPEDGDLLREARRAAVVHQRTVATETPSPDSDEEASSSQTALVIPLKLRDQVIGTVALHETRHQRPWTAEEITLAETVAEQVTQTVENLRLLDETQRRAARERGAREIADRMQRATDIETLMHITAEELKRALGDSRVYVRLGTETPLPQAGGDGHTSEGDS
jgi:GAF domain-containing protein